MTDLEQQWPAILDILRAGLEAKGWGTARYRRTGAVIDPESALADLRTALDYFEAREKERDIAVATERRARQAQATRDRRRRRREGIPPPATAPHAGGRPPGSRLERLIRFLAGVFARQTARSPWITRSFSADMDVPEPASGAFLDFVQAVAPLTRVGSCTGESAAHAFKRFKDEYRLEPGRGETDQNWAADLLEPFPDPSAPEGSAVETFREYLVREGLL